MTSRLQRFLNTRTTLQLNRHRESAVILLLHEIGTDTTPEDRNKRETENEEDHRNRHGLVMQTPSERALIEGIDLIQQTHHRAVVPGLLTGLIIDQVTLLIHMHFLGFEELRAEHRRQRDSHQRRGTTYNRYDPT